MAPEVVAASLGALGEAALDAAEAVAGLGDSEVPGTSAAAYGAAGERRRREGMKSIGFWTSIPAYKQFWVLAISEEETGEHLLNEALNLLFVQRGLEPIAPQRV